MSMTCMWTLWRIRRKNWWSRVMLMISRLGRGCRVGRGLLCRGRLIQGRWKSHERHQLHRVLIRYRNSRITKRKNANSKSWKENWKRKRSWNRNWETSNKKPKKKRAITERNINGPRNAAARSPKTRKTGPSALQTLTLACGQTVPDPRPTGAPQYPLPQSTRITSKQWQKVCRDWRERAFYSRRKISRNVAEVTSVSRTMLKKSARYRAGAVSTPPACMKTIQRTMSTCYLLETSSKRGVAAS